MPVDNKRPAKPQGQGENGQVGNLTEGTNCVRVHPTPQSNSVEGFGHAPEFEGLVSRPDPEVMNRGGDGREVIC